MSDEERRRRNRELVERSFAAVSRGDVGGQLEHCTEEIRIYGHDAVYGVYRLLERLGNALGPLIASLLVIFWGYQGAFVALSAFVLFCGVAFTVATRGADWEPAAA